LRGCYVEIAAFPAAFGSVEPPCSIGADVNILANDQRVRYGKTLRPSGKAYREERLRVASDPGHTARCQCPMDSPVLPNGISVQYYPDWG
jgi:hypothetical protein